MTVKVYSTDVKNKKENSKRLAEERIFIIEILPVIALVSISQGGWLPSNMGLFFVVLHNILAYGDLEFNFAVGRINSVWLSMLHIGVQISFVPFLCGFLCSITARFLAERIGLVSRKGLV